MKIAFVESPGSILSLEGEILGDAVTNHPKYSQLQLMANMPEDIEVDLVDLKTLPPVKSESYREIEYEGRSIECLRRGTSLDDASERLSEYDLIGITANFTSERNVIVDTIRAIKRKNPNLPIILGGHDATVCPSYYLQRGADICVIGDGETIARNLSLGLDKTDLKNTRGIATLDSEGHKYKAPREDLTKIGFPSADLLKRYRFNEIPDGPLPAGVSDSIAAIETSRGCDEACSFCDSTFVIGKYKMFPFETLERKIDALSEADTKTLIFVDDNLLYRSLPKYGGKDGRDEIIKFFNKLRDQGFAWSFYNGLQISLLYRDGVLDSELIDSLYGNRKNEEKFEGCFRAYLPLEKFWPDEMLKLPKLLPLEKEMQIVEAISKRQVPHLNLGFIIGNPRETEESLQYSVEKAKEFGELINHASEGHSTPRFYPWCSVPIPGTPDARNYLPHIRYDAENFPELYINYVSVMESRDFSPYEIASRSKEIDDELNNDNITRHEF
ncbi:cobalamin B12-binding domain-containing protein [Candidatus Woesearchaeota archaeon]|nr:cobalamin B12-binding domain-containing protein [Candidatus Woesearchaeota archaeon]